MMLSMVLWQHLVCSPRFHALIRWVIRWVIHEGPFALPSNIMRFDHFGYKPL